MAVGAGLEPARVLKYPPVFKTGALANSAQPTLFFILPLNFNKSTIKSTNRVHCLALFAIAILPTRIQN